ncbi:MAG TPA: hypothetical protein VL393_08095 [Candidatus Binataceae bacterium]|nr:hypothetical protein [Candidatus Binataceae bacterium]
MTQRAAPENEFSHTPKRSEQPPIETGVAPKACDFRSLGALVLYFALSFLFFGRSLFGNLTTLHIGAGPDPGLMMWFLVWWPHAIINGINPLLSSAIFAPTGFNLAWQTSIPLASVIASPLTATLGPVAAFNILCLLSLPLDAWCAFILCRYITRSYLSSLLAGYIFGFSAFTLGHLTFGDLPLLTVFPVPLTVYFAVRQIADEISERNFVRLMTLLLLVQFLLSLEIFATMTMFGVIALGLGVALTNDNQIKQRMLSFLKPMAKSYTATLIVVSPYLYYFFKFGFTSKPIWPPSFFNADLLNFIVPTQANELGRFSLLKSASVWFPGGSIAENGACLSLPLVLIAALYARQHWREPLGKLLTDLLIIFCVLSLGPILHVAGREIPSYLPWRLFMQLPILNDIVTVRLAMYAFLDLAIITSLWLSTADLKLPLKLAIVFSIIAANTPNLSSAFWDRNVDTPSFFRTNLFQRYLSKGETTLVLPYGDNGNAMLWQAQTKMFFAMAGGMAPPVGSDELYRWPIFGAFINRSWIPDAPRQFKTFLTAHGVNAVIAADWDAGTWQPLFTALDIAPIRVGGVWLYRLGPETAADSKTALLDMRTRFDAQRLSALVRTAEKYLSAGGALSSLTMTGALDQNLLPREELVGPSARFDSTLAGRRPVVDPRFVYGTWLSSWSDDRVAIGEYVWYPMPLIAKFRGVTSEIYFPFPTRLSSDAPVSDTHAYGFLMMIFDRQQLRRAAALLDATPQGTSPAGKLSTLFSHASNPQ